MKIPSFPLAPFILGWLTALTFQDRDIFIFLLFCELIIFLIAFASSWIRVKWIFFSIFIFSLGGFFGIVHSVDPGSLKMDFNQKVFLRGWVISDPEFQKKDHYSFYTCRFYSPEKGLFSRPYEISFSSKEFSRFLVGRGMEIIGKGGGRYVKVKDSFIRPKRSFPRSVRIRIFMERIRRKIEKGLKENFRGRYFGFAFALLSGEKRRIDGQSYSIFRRLGLLHLLAVSGLHLGIVVFWAYWFGRKALGSRKIGSVLGLLAMLFFIWFAGPRIPLLRASFMASAFLISIILERDHYPIYILLISAFFITLIFPEEIWRVGFHLSFFATGGILLWSPIFLRFFRVFLGPWMGGLLSVNLSALWFTLPFQIGVFHAVSLISPISNLFAIPLVGCFLPFLFLSAFLYPLSPFLSAVMAWISKFFIQLLIPLLQGLDFLTPYHMIHFSSFSFIFWFGWVLVWFLCFAIKKETSRIPWLIASFFFCALGLWAPYYFSPHPASKIFFFDVGQGDAALIFTRKKTILVDTGPSSSRRKFLTRLAAAGVNRLDYLLVTHFHADHDGNVEPVLAEYKVERILIQDPHRLIPFPLSISHEKKLEGILKKKPIDFIQGLRPWLGGWLWADRVPHLWEPLNPAMNNTSIVFRIPFGNTFIFFAGDIEKESERALMSLKKIAFHSQILKVPHHGGKTSSTPLFLNRVKPSLAVISCGLGNRYGHPAFSTLQRYRKRKVQVFRTDQDGEVEIGLIKGGIYRRVLSQGVKRLLGIRQWEFLMPVL